ncbi:hypothetical protein AAON49_06340 [Pseudotenacibaculum sp. MALMAid0570]|uniref:hypothetical protein n=1 Tax=Pseudotenacibaculum sp. MALMAid0570 TaxID=3143938 RepID=UPI0032DEDDF2
MYKKLKIALFISILFSVSSVKAQCAMCKAVVENGEVTMAEGINSGITYLMVFPYILIGVLFYFLYRYKKSAKN